MEDEKQRDEAPAEPKRDEVEAQELSEEEMEKAAGGDPGWTWGPQWQGTGGH